MRLIEDDLQHRLQTFLTELDGRNKVHIKRVNFGGSLSSVRTRVTIEAWGRTISQVGKAIHTSNEFATVDGLQANGRLELEITAHIAGARTELQYVDLLAEEICVHLYNAFGGDAELTDDDEELD